MAVETEKKQRQSNIPPVLSDNAAATPQSSVYVSTSCRILSSDPEHKQESIFNIFGIGRHTAVKTGH